MGVCRSSSLGLSSCSRTPWPSRSSPSSRNTSKHTQLDALPRYDIPSKSRHHARLTTHDIYLSVRRHAMPVTSSTVPTGFPLPGSLSLWCFPTGLNEDHRTYLTSRHALPPRSLLTADTVLPCVPPTYLPCSAPICYILYRLS